MIIQLSITIMFLASALNSINKRWFNMNTKLIVRSKMILNVNTAPDSFISASGTIFDNAIAPLWSFTVAPDIVAIKLLGIPILSLDLLKTAVELSADAQSAIMKLETPVALTAVSIAVRNIALAVDIPLFRLRTTVVDNFLILFRRSKLPAAWT